MKALQLHRKVGTMVALTLTVIAVIVAFTIASNGNIPLVGSATDENTIQRWEGIEYAVATTGIPPQDVTATTALLQGETPYTVRYGDTVYGIAARFGVTPQSIIQRNNIQPPYYVIYVGQVLIIPTGGGTPPTPPPDNPPPTGETQYTVRAGDSVILIANRFGVTAQSIIERNNLRPPYYVIYVGQVLIIPGTGGTPPTPPPGGTPAPTPPPTGESQYTVRAGDTVYGIASRFGVTPQSIIQRNNLRPPYYVIYVGQVLIIPGTGGGGATPQPTPPPGGTPAPTPPPAGAMGWGIQGQFFNQNMTQAVRGASDMNLQWLKQQIRWQDFETTPGDISWGPIDDIVNGAPNNPFLFSILAAPGWARPAGHDPAVVGPPADPATYASFVGAVAGRYCGRVQAIEVWNEQNLAYEWGNEPLDAAKYMDLLRAAHGSIKAACPGTLVISGALTPTGAPPPAAVDDFTYLQQMYNNGLRNYADGVGVHPSGFNIPPQLYYTQACAYIQQTNATFNGPCNSPHHSWTFRSTLEGTRNIMVQNGHAGAKLWVTEFGWAVGSGSAVPESYGYARDNTREEQAAWTSQAFSMARDSGYVGGMFLWNLNFAIVAPGSEQSLWSVYDDDFNPTITVPAVRDTPH
jgi:LysM repeat protein